MIIKYFQGGYLNTDNVPEWNVEIDQDSVSSAEIDYMVVMEWRMCASEFRELLLRDGLSREEAHGLATHISHSMDAALKSGEPFLDLEMICNRWLHENFRRRHREETGEEHHATKEVEDQVRDKTKYQNGSEKKT